MTARAALCAVRRKGKAYVDSLSAEEMKEYRGTLKQPGKDSPYRTRSVEENLALFEAMRNGEVRPASPPLSPKTGFPRPARAPRIARE